MDLVPPKPGPLHLTALCPESKPWGIQGSLASGRSSGTLRDLSGHPAWRFPKSQSTPKSPKIGCYMVVINGKTWENQWFGVHSVDPIF